MWLCMLGFPIALVLAWAFELTPGGLKREAEVDRDASSEPAGRRVTDGLLIGLLLIVVAFVAWDQWSGDSVDDGAGGIAEVEGLAGIERVMLVGCGQLAAHQPGDARRLWPVHDVSTTGPVVRGAGIRWSPAAGFSRAPRTTADPQRAPA